MSATTKLVRFKDGKYKGVWGTVLSTGQTECHVKVFDVPGITNVRETVMGEGVPLDQITEFFELDPDDADKIDSFNHTTLTFPVRLHLGKKKYILNGPNEEAILQRQSAPPPRNRKRRRIVRPKPRSAVTLNQENVSQILEVNFSDLEEFMLRTPVESAVMLWGPPGVGKSEFIKNFAKRIGYTVIDLRLYQLDPVDIRGVGIPDIQGGVTRWLPPEFFPRKEKTLLFLDELPAAPPAVQAIAYQLILDRRIGEHVLPSDCRVVAAGNRMQDRGVVYKMPAPLANRFLHFELNADYVVWREWAVLNKIAPEIIAYLGAKPDMLHKMDVTNSSGPWPSPRTWEFVSRLFKNGLVKGNGDFHAVASAVGYNAAVDFIEFLDSVQVNPEEMLNSPEGVESMAKSDQTVLALALPAYTTKDSDDITKKILVCAQRMEQEIAALCVDGLDYKLGEEIVNEIAEDLGMDLTDFRPPTEEEYQEMKLLEV